MLCLRPHAAREIFAPMRCALAQLKRLLEHEDDAHRTAEHKLRERAAHVTWEEVLACFEVVHMFEGHSDSFSDGFRISVLGF